MFLDPPTRFLGSALAMEGIDAWIGASGDSNGANLAGAVHVMQHDGNQWNELQKLQASDPQANAGFGKSVARSGSLAAVGAPGFDTAFADHGAVYLFQKIGGQWVEIQKEVGRQSGDYFGSAVALHGNQLLIGTATAEVVYAYGWTGSAWVENQVLVDPLGPDGDGFGTSLTMDGGTSVIGSFASDVQGRIDAGAAHVFEFDGVNWQASAQLNNPAPFASQLFGWSVDLSADRVFVGEPRNAPFRRNGAVHVFERAGAAWNWTQELSITKSGAEFGTAVAADGDHLLVGTYETTARHAVTHFEHDGSSWQEVQRLKAADVVIGDEYGSRVALAGSLALVAARRHDALAGDSGAVYAFRLEDLSLYVNRVTAGPGNALTFTTCRGQPNGLSALYVLDVNGTPLFVRLSLRTFDNQGEWQLSGNVPVGLSGLAIRFVTLGPISSGGAGGSNRVTIQFL